MYLIALVSQTLLSPGWMHRAASCLSNRIRRLRTNMWHARCSRSSASPCRPRWCAVQCLFVLFSISSPHFAYTTFLYTCTLLHSYRASFTIRSDLNIVLNLFVSSVDVPCTHYLSACLPVWMLPHCGTGPTNYRRLPAAEWADRFTASHTSAGAGESARVCFGSARICT